jgi:hypothetical protein
LDHHFALPGEFFFNILLVCGIKCDRFGGYLCQPFAERNQGGYWQGKYYGNPVIEEAPKVSMRSKPKLKSCLSRRIRSASGFGSIAY